MCLVRWGATHLSYDFLEWEHGSRISHICDGVLVRRDSDPHDGSVACGRQIQNGTRKDRIVIGLTVFLLAAVLWAVTTFR